MSRINKGTSAIIALAAAFRGAWLVTKRARLLFKKASALEKNCQLTDSATKYSLQAQELERELTDVSPLNTLNEPKSWSANSLSRRTRYPNGVKSWNANSPEVIRLVRLVVGSRHRRIVTHARRVLRPAYSRAESCRAGSLRLLRRPPPAQTQDGQAPRRRWRQAPTLPDKTLPSSDGISKRWPGAKKTQSRAGG
jgi:hypothetical protein